TCAAVNGTCPVKVCLRAVLYLRWFLKSGFVQRVRKFEFWNGRKYSEIQKKREGFEPDLAGFVNHGIDCVDK
ncbi:hypothetical protein KI387_035586, partial [Taxus chinensis]